MIINLPAKTLDLVNMANKLKEVGVIDGIGMQSHLTVGSPSGQAYATAIEKFLDTGLEVYITELDITTNNEKDQASSYKEIFSIALKYANKIPSVTFWGTHDNTSSKSSQYPLPFGANYTPKQAYYSILTLVHDLWP